MSYVLLVLSLKSKVLERRRWQVGRNEATDDYCSPTVTCHRLDIANVGFRTAGIIACLLKFSSGGDVFTEIFPTSIVVTAEIYTLVAFKISTLRGFDEMVYLN